MCEAVARVCPARAQESVERAVCVRASQGGGACGLPGKPRGRTSFHTPWVSETLVLHRAVKRAVYLADELGPEADIFENNGCVAEGNIYNIHPNAILHLRYRIRYKVRNCQFEFRSNIPLLSQTKD